LQKEISLVHLHSQNEQGVSETEGLAERSERFKSFNDYRLREEVEESLRRGSEMDKTQNVL
jgi:hypothetical protein